MSITTREVKNKKNTEGIRTGKAGTVYDVTLKYKTQEGYKSYGKRGFLTRSDALQHEAAIRMKFARTNGNLADMEASHQRLKDYLELWIIRHGAQNLRPSTLAGYHNHINAYIIPYLGELQLGQITPAILDDFYEKLLHKDLAVSTVRYTHRVISVALEHAYRYGYIDSNPARRIIIRFRDLAKTPEPYNIQEMQHLLCCAMNTEWEMIILLAGLYGLRRSEITGLRWRNVDLRLGIMKIVEQQPYGLAKDTTIVSEMAPPKTNDRLIPITSIMRKWFEKQRELQKQHRALCKTSGFTYYENDLIIALPNGAPVISEHISAVFAQLLRKWGCRHIRFHDLRHSAATNMHDLTGDFLTVGEILGHTVEGLGLSLGISNRINSVTEQYVHVRLGRKLAVLETYHEALLEKM